MDSQTSLKTSQREGCNPLNPPPGYQPLSWGRRTSPGNCICCHTRARWSIVGQGQSIYSPLILRVWPNLKKYHFVNYDLVLVFFVSTLLFIDHDMCFKLKSWNAIEKTISVKHYFLFFLFSLILLLFLLFLLFIIFIIFRGCALWQRKRKQLCFEFQMNPNEYLISLIFHHLFHEEKNMATEYLNVRVVLRLVLGKDHPSCQPLLQLEKNNGVHNGARRYTLYAGQRTWTTSLPS